MKNIYKIAKDIAEITGYHCIAHVIPQGSNHYLSRIEYIRPNKPSAKLTHLHHYDHSVKNPVSLYDSILNQIILSIESLAS